MAKESSSVVVGQRKWCEGVSNSFQFETKCFGSSVCLSYNCLDPVPYVEGNGPT